MAKSKPCPFCGGEAEPKMYLWGHHKDDGHPIWCFYVYCLGCDAMTDNIFRSKEEAVAAWNRRDGVTAKWISTKDRLPDKDGLYLVAVSGKPQENITLCGAYELAEYTRKEGWILEVWPEWDGAIVTHWMPIPDLLEEGHIADRSG